MIDGVKVMFTSEEEVEADAADAASAAIDAEYVAKEKYKDDRRRAYPDLGDQMDMQYHDLLDGTTKWKDAIKAVKADFKKP
tara:strand:+ start:357 stop:599 length:243 start_codon:yes stop_codon:yes gene_type:complete